MAWQQVNPDLRMGGPSLSRLAALRVAIGAIRPETIKPPVLILENGQSSATLCGHMVACEHRRLEGGADFYLEADPERQAWLEAVTRFFDHAVETKPAS